MQSVTTLAPTGINVYLNNRYRNSMDNAYHFSVNQVSQLPSDVREYLVMVRQMFVRSYLPTITTGQNDLLRYEYNGTAYSVVFAQGLYDATTLASSIQTALQARNGGFACSYDSVSYKFSITVPSGQTFKLKRSTDSLGLTNDARYFPDAGDAFLEISGFIRNASVLYSGSITFSAVDPVNLYGSSTISVALSSSHLNVTSMNPANPQILGCIPVTGAYGGLEQYTPATPPAFRMQANDLQYLYVDLQDEWGRPIYPTNDNAFVLIHLHLVPM